MYGQVFHNAYYEAMLANGIDIGEWEELSEEDQDAHDIAAQAVIDVYDASSPCVEE